MLFNSLSFFLFFVLVLLAHLLPLPWKLRKFNVLAASYLFYTAWNPPYVGLLVVSTLIDWFAARGMHAQAAVVGQSLYERGHARVFQIRRGGR